MYVITTFVNAPFIIIYIRDIMGTELLMPLYKQWGVTHDTFDVIVLTSLEKSFSRLHHRIFLYINVCNTLTLNMNLKSKTWRNWCCLMRRI